MRIGKVPSAAVIIVNTLLTASAWTAAASAEPQQFDCILTDTEAHPGSEHRLIVVIFDTDARTLTAKDDDRSYSFSKVAISNVTINGLDDNVTLGIDLSSLGIVWQQYGTDQVSTEYGRCRAHS